MAGNTHNELLVWHLETQALQSTVTVGPGSITHLLHPFAYKNKVLIGFDDGALQLWNVSTSQLVHTFTAHLLPTLLDSGLAKPAAVTVMEQAPALHVVAVGFSTGRVALLHLQEERLLRDFQLDWGAVTSLAFRHSDGVAGADSLLLAGSAAGHISLWQLASGRLVGELRSAHRGAVTGLGAVRGQPLLVSNAGDNALRVWLWETGAELPRLLHERAGHAAPPCALEAATGRQLLSSGQDAVVRLFSTAVERDNRSLGRAALNRKDAKKLRRDAGSCAEEKHRLDDVAYLGGVTQLAGSMTRAGDWDTLAAAHVRDRRVTTWDVHRGCRGKHLLQPAAMLLDERRFKATEASSVFATSCGHFVLVGYSSGHVVRFNLQSGLERCSYPAAPREKLPKEGALGLPLSESRMALGGGKRRGKAVVAPAWAAAHEGAVAGLACDALNRVVSSAGCEQLRFFHFKTGAPLGEPLPLGEEAALLQLHRSAGYLVVGLASGRLLLVDAFRRRVLRRLLGHYPSPLTAVALAPCSAQLLSAGADGLLRLWDLLEGKLVDCFRVAAPATALLWLPQGDIVASCHEGQLGVHLWTNRAAYESDLVLTPLPEDYRPPLADTMALPVTAGQPADAAVDVDLDEEAVEADDVVRQLRPDCVTLSGQSEGRLLQVLNLEDFRERGQSALEPATAAVEAPFFLPSVQQPQVAPAAVPDSKSAWLVTPDCLLAQRLGCVVTALNDDSCVHDDGAIEQDQELSAVLWEPIFVWLESLGPSLVDAQILGLASCSGATRAALLRCCAAALQARRHFDTVSVYLAAALRHWGGAAAAEADGGLLARELARTLAAQKVVGQELFQLADDIDALLTVHQTGLLGLHLD